MNRGLLVGLEQPQIQFYKPTMICANNGGALTDPDLTQVDGHSFQYGRYLLVAPALVYVEVQIQLLGAQGGSTGALGSGGVWCISLPDEYPLKRAVPGAIDRSVLSPASGMCYLSFGSATTPDVNVEAVPVAADPWSSLNGREDRYFSAMVPYILDFGTAPGVAGATQTVTHDAGFAFDPRDLVNIWTADSSNNALCATAITSVTSTTFVQTNHSNGIPASWWKVRAEPPTGQAGALISPTVPWGWDKVTSITPFGNLFFTLLYEPRI